MDSVASLFSFLPSALSNLLLGYNFLGLNWIDFIIIVIIVFYAIEGHEIGFTYAFFDFLSFILSFFIALETYRFVAHGLYQIFGMPIGISNALSFFIVAMFVEICSNVFFRLVIIPRIPFPKVKTKQMFFRKLDHWAGIIPGMVSSILVVSFLLTLIVALPVSPVLKSLASTSAIGSHLLTYTTSFEGNLNTIFGGALHETLAYLTVEPKSNESINLHFTVPHSTIDTDSEKNMLIAVNQERTSRGLPSLITDPQLTTLARTYAQDMFARGYFSHFNPEGKSPFDRMQAAGITYTSAGENLALAPTVSLAMQGLMNSPGHKANILSPNYGHVGIGVTDGGIYGKMFVQEFTN